MTVKKARGKKRPPEWAIPRPLLVSLYCNPSAHFHSELDAGERMFTLLACDGNTLLLENVMGHRLRCRRSEVQMVRVFRCRHRITADGWLELRDPADVDAPYVRLCPWNFHDKNVPLVEPERRGEVAVRPRRGAKQKDVIEDDWEE